MRTEFEITDNILIVKLSGEIDHHEAAEIRNEIDSTYSVFGSKHMILDFSQVSFVDSSGIGVVMGRYNKVKEKGGSILIAGCSEYLRTILFLSGIFTIIEESASAEEGILLLKQRSVAEKEGEEETGKTAGDEKDGGK